MTRHRMAEGEPMSRWFAMVAPFSLTACATLPANVPLPVDQIRIVRSALKEHGSALWPGWSEDPASVLVVGARRETLFCAPPRTGFSNAGRDPVTGCTTQSRPARLPADIEAPVELDGVPVAAMGLPSATGREPADWALVLAHEQFHVWQDGAPGYRAAVEGVAVQLAPPGAQSANWMLDHPFPYAEAARHFVPMSEAALRFLDAPTDTTRRAAVRDYLVAREEAAQMIGPRDWLYYEFQVGQEGVGRWTELALAENLAADDPSFAYQASERRGGLATSLRAIERDGLGMWKRSAFYAFGAVEAEMLDTLDPGWRADYSARPFALGEMLAERLHAP